MAGCVENGRPKRSVAFSGQDRYGAIAHRSQVEQAVLIQVGRCQVKIGARQKGGRLKRAITIAEQDTDSVGEASIGKTRSCQVQVPVAIKISRDGCCRRGTCGIVYFGLEGSVSVAQ